MKDKICTVCNKRLPFSMFYKAKQGKFGLRSECRICHSERRRKTKLKELYNLTIVEYDLLYKKQDGYCLICGNKETYKHPTSNEVRRLSIDHNHKTGQIRGLLCNRCNHLVGFIENNYFNKELTEKVINYLGDNNE